MEPDPPKLSLDNPRTKKIMHTIFKNSVILSPSTIATTERKKAKLWAEIVKKVKNFQNLIKYNSITFKSQLDIEKNSAKKVCFFSHWYTLSNQSEKEAFIEKISSLLYFSYRSNFPPLPKDIDSRNETAHDTNKDKDDDKDTDGHDSGGSSHYTSDCGWGCMIRSSQMILSRALYKIFKRKYPSKKENVLLQCLFYFFDYPCDYRNLPDSFLSVLAQYNSTIRHGDSNSHSHSNSEAKDKDKKEIESIFSPFSLRTICSVGCLFNKRAGQWFSDFHLPQIFNLINREFDVIDDLSIMHFQGFINKSIVIEDCFIEAKPMSNVNPQAQANDINLNDIYFDINTTFLDKTYFYTKSGLIFVSTRLGLDKISPDYYDSIKEVFNCKQFLGFIGGKGVMAYYFFGYDSNHLLYLDPHFNQEASSNINDDLLNSYLPKKIFQLKFDKLQTCLTFAFLFRDFKEYTLLFNWLEKYSQRTNPCVTVVDNVDMDNINKEDMINFDKDDF